MLSGYIVFLCCVWGDRVIQYNDDIYSVQIIRSQDEFSTIAEQWDLQLKGSEAKTLHLSYNYLSAIWQADDGVLNPHIIIIYKQDTIVGFAALDKSKYMYRSFEIDAALPLDYRRYGRSDVVIYDAGALPILYNAVHKLDVDIWHLDRFPSDSKFIEYCEDNLSDKIYYSYENYDLAILDTGSSWDEFLASKSKNFRRTYKRMKEASSALRSEFYAGRHVDVDKIIQDMSYINAQSWKSGAGSDFSQDPKRMKFFKLLMTDAADQENLVASLLYDEDEPVAFTFGIIFNDTLYALETGYMSEYADRSAGIMSYAMLMQHAFDTANIIACDMDTIRTNGGYKKRWATHINSQRSALILFGGKGSLLIRAGRFAGRIKKALGRS